MEITIASLPLAFFPGSNPTALSPVSSLGVEIKSPGMRSRGLRNPAPGRAWRAQAAGWERDPGRGWREELPARVASDGARLASIF